ncbi:hypothetical protein ATZ36_11920 [Candidatus Endomicrobiellum trichonymphae]|uniref:Uncharacterized protein n=1 Tax=Endomicrobium trichonymphae TaxID=1408204 RepID=A0A1E5IN80_ENDTX|nr:hypothetical protein ATZ36_11920 [Candidatus Endomicrobium trichonymphae]
MQLSGKSLSLIWGGSRTTAEDAARLNREFKIIEELDYAKTHIKQRIDNMSAVEYFFIELPL